MRPVELPKGWSPRLAVVAGLALIVVWVAIERATTGAWHHVPLGRPSNEYIAAGIGAVMVGVAEEFVFRGIVMGELWRRYGFWLANIGAAVLFAMIHWPGWVLLEHASLGSVLASSGYLFLFGLVMGGLARLEGGIVMAAVVHGLNDLLVGAGFN
jgi:membrane protease YdiL (CAAX protease family)